MLRMSLPFEIGVKNASVQVGFDVFIRVFDK